MFKGTTLPERLKELACDCGCKEIEKHQEAVKGISVTIPRCKNCEKQVNWKKTAGILQF